MDDIKFKKRCLAFGKNGHSYCEGLHIGQYTRVSESNEVIHMTYIQPINSKGNLTKCYIEIPCEDLEKVIKILQDKYDHFTTTTTV